MGELSHRWIDVSQALISDRQRQQYLHRFVLGTTVVPLDDYQQSIIGSTVRPYKPMINGNRFKKLHLGTQMYELRLSFGVVRIRLVKESVIEGSSQQGHTILMRRPTHCRVVATFLPKVTTWKVLECTFNRKYTTIDAGLQTYNVRPEWSPIFARASRGDMEGVRSLLEEGLASLNDVDPEGWTVLHVCLSSFTTFFFIDTESCYPF